MVNLVQYLFARYHVSNEAVHRIVSPHQANPWSVGVDYSRRIIFDYETLMNERLAKVRNFREKVDGLLDKMFGVE